MRAKKYLEAHGEIIARGKLKIGRGMLRSELLKLGFTKKELDHAWEKNEIVKTLVSRGGVQCFYYAPYAQVDSTNALPPG